MSTTVKLITYTKDELLHGYSLYGVALTLFFSGLFFFLKKEWSIHSPSKLPIVGIDSPGYFGLLKARRHFVTNGRQILKDAYYKYYKKNFVITTNSCEKIILTFDQTKELSNAPEDTVSFIHAINELMMADYTGLNRAPGSHILKDVIRIKLTQNLGSMKEAQMEETQFALNTEMPQCTTDGCYSPTPILICLVRMLIKLIMAEWTSVNIYSATLRMVARISGRAFIGLPLCRDEDWLTVSINFTNDVFNTAAKLATISKLIRPFYAYIQNSTKAIEAHRRKARALLAPTIQRRLEEETLGKESGTAHREYNDLLQWLSDRIESQHKNVDHLAELQLSTSMASIHTTTSSLVNTILDLAEHQEYIQPIREEIEAVISTNDGMLDRRALRKMRKTDSFLKESMKARLGLLTFNRKVMKSLTLSDGTYLPKGTLIAAPHSIFSTDPDYIEDPEAFDGFRWYKKALALKDGMVDNNYSASAAPENLAFGQGKHACPGRFFATEEIKLILIYILLQYDLKYPEGQSRPDNIDNGEFTFPDFRQKLLFKKLPGPKKFSFL
ncbi:cytochrome P450 [Choiromyces venosus 120613-1]|uniref:Cytochrome P450 n=1 Tax=Choiromyces venosus 120613-1 TaxID=1336337 RepID=A0A3N4JFJ1_9PEZI|nr:cytochrome P450 [Choiromyces venosus 120613-1]